MSWDPARTVQDSYLTSDAPSPWPLSQTATHTFEVSDNTCRAYRWTPNVCWVLSICLKGAQSLKETELSHTNSKFAHGSLPGFQNPACYGAIFIGHLKMLPVDTAFPSTYISLKNHLSDLIHRKSMAFLAWKTRVTWIFSYNEEKKCPSLFCPSNITVCLLRDTF